MYFQHSMSGSCFVKHFERKVWAFLSCTWHIVITAAVLHDFIQMLASLMLTSLVGLPRYIYYHLQN